MILPMDLDRCALCSHERMFHDRIRRLCTFILTIREPLDAPNPVAAPCVCVEFVEEASVRIVAGARSR